MTSITNLFSNIIDLTENKTSTGYAKAYAKNKYNLNKETPALTQGERFKKYQKKIKKKLVKEAEQLSGKEGFGGINLEQLNLNPNGLTKQSEEIIDENNYSSQQQTITTLQQQYQNALTQYEKLLAETTNDLSEYIDRTNPNANPYLNKTIRFSTGQIAYVTQQGAVKYIPTNDIWYSVNAPKQWIQLNIPWNDAWNNTPGITIPTTPPLVTGTTMKLGQSLGNEGANIYVNKIINNPSPTYEGCYADNIKSPLMTFIGGAPPPPSGSLQNGSFSQPQIANNSYQYISSNSTVVGWNFYAVLINNSSDWGFPMPYPAGNQAACIQSTQIFGQWINLDAGSYTITFYACGRPGFSGANTINVYCGQSTTLTGNTVVFTFTPPTTAWQNYTATINISPSGNYAIGFYGTINSINNSTAIQNIVLTASGVTSQGKYTYEMCEQAAIDNSYKYFALQNVNPSTSQGYCAVSNNQPSITSLGTAVVPSQQNPLWYSNTFGTNSAALTVTGSLTVYNSSGASVYATPSPQNTTYVGCYGDTPNRAMQNTSNNQWLPFSQCQQLAESGGFTYFATQASGNGNGWCAASNDLSQSTQYGVANNCTQNDGTWMGGSWSNAIYSLNNNGNFCLILLDSGNMIIQRGTSPSDNQGIVWQTNTTANQPNPQYAAANGTYGKNWINQGSTLAIGDFIGSPNGYIALMMRQDGNLVLYTFSTVSNCQKMNDGNTGGGAGANAIYNIGQVGVSSNMGKLAYIDQNSELHPYPSTNVKFTNSYTQFTNTDDDSSTGNNIPGASYGNATVEQCQTTCNNMSNCGGFTFSNNTCYPKTTQIYPNGKKNPNVGVDLYVRNTMPLSPPLGVTTQTNNTDSITYNNYVNGGALSSEYGLSAATSAQKQQLQQLQNTMNSLTDQISDLTTKFGEGSQTAASQMSKNVLGVGEYLNNLTENNKKIKHYNTSIDNILQDSDIVVLQKNYDYLFWSILAAGSVLVAMNFVKK